MKWWKWLVRALIALAILVLLGIGITHIWQSGQISGTVVSKGRPVAGAVVRLKTTSFETRTDANGQFLLQFSPPRFSVPVTAWIDGAYVAGTVVYPWQKNVSIPLEAYRTTDNPNYGWVLPRVENRPALENLVISAGLPVAARLSFKQLFLPLSSKFTLGCADCHGSIIYKQYAGSAHAQGTNNIRFTTVYNGTDVHGNKSPLTRYGNSRDYGSFPLRPDPTQPWYGPGFKLDFPDQAGNCAACHMPAEALAAPLNTAIDKIPKTALQGTNCDFCHKIADVRLNPSTNLPFENSPGVLSMTLHRPDGEPQIFFGPFDDVDVGPDTYLPLQAESKVCAACHNASFWGTPIYQSYAEWLNSPYPAEGKTCQSCHMKPDGVTDNFAPGHGGNTRDPQQIFTHNFPGVDDTLLKNTAKLQVSAKRQGDRILVDVSVTNENAGHDMPTDSPMRNILLVISATDASGKPLAYSGDQTLPDWAGQGNSPTDYAGRPGKGYAKILQEVWTEVSPTITYWKQTTIKEDNRIPARATDVTHYEFRASSPGAIKIDANLIFRRAFKDLAAVKGWDLPDIEMAHVTASLSAP